MLCEHCVEGFLSSRGYYAAKKRKPSNRQLRDEILIEEIKKIHAENYGVYGVRKMHRAMRRAGWDIGRDQTARLMRLAGVEGVRRGRTPITTRPAVNDSRPDLVQRDFTASRPNQLWVGDITYVRTTYGFVYTAFVIDVYTRKIVGWAVGSTLKTEDLPLQALEQAIALAKDSLEGLVHHSDHGSQYMSIVYNNKLADHGIIPSTGTVGDSYDNALAETTGGLYKNELIYSRRWESVWDVEYATLNWVYWYNTQRLHEALNYHTSEETITMYNQHRANTLVPV